MRTLVLYISFAILAIMANLAVQQVTLRIVNMRFALLLAMVLGTLAGLVLKYALDKIWIFRFKHNKVSHNLRTFVLYSVMGVATTAIFWATELFATAVSDRTFARNLGAIIGLAIGYYVKYRLDKRFVFTHQIRPG